MKFQSFDWHSWLVVVLLGGFSSFIYLVGGYCYSFFLTGFGLQVWGIFSFDGVSFYLSLLSLFLWASLLFFGGGMSSRSNIIISFSLLFSILSYSCANALLFWVFYELSILCLLFLLIVESPYSERYIAGWYLLGYVVLTSLPMLLCLLFICVDVGSFNMLFWGCCGPLSSSILMVLGVLFVTKVPLPPFHVWLPIVHAEASSAVSVCLSGYVMKLGLLGVVRFCSFVLPHGVFNSAYLGICLSLAILFFLSASRELDGKRWLAFLSLSHIIVAALCLSVCSWGNASLSFLFCLGHGLSAGVIFLLLWFIYEVCGSRNWIVLKSCLNSSLVVRCVVVVCLCTAGSLPPTVQFFSEVMILVEAGFFSSVLSCLLFLYLFVSGLVPLFFVGTLLSQHFSVGIRNNGNFSFLSGIGLLGVWSFLLFLVF